MRLAEDIVVTIGLRPVRLHPSLRAATLLERKFGGFDKLLAQIADGRLSAMVEVVSASSDRADILAALAGVPLITILPTLIAQTSKHVLALAGFNYDAPKSANTTGKRITFAEHHESLFRIATGWLGWSPKQAWDASPAEILAAYQGHLEKLRAIHGGAEPEATTPNNAELDRAGLGRLKALRAA